MTFASAGGRLTALMLMVYGCVGCAFYTYREIGIRVEDGATMQPVEGARVRVEYQTVLQIFSKPKPAEGITSKNGTVNLPLTSAKAFVLVNASGYQPADQDITGKYRATLPPQMIFRLEKK